MKIAGIILAGGESSRYGKPKMFELFKDQCFYEYSVAALKENRLAPIIIATNEHLLPYFKRDDVDFIIEDMTYQGPLFAMYHALSNIQDAEWFFVLSCDIPFVTSSFVQKMIIFTKEDAYDAIVPIQAGRIHPLMALYHRRSLIPMKQLINKNEKKVRLLLDEIRVKTVPFSAEDQALLNINHQEDWLMYSLPSEQTKEEKK